MGIPKRIFVEFSNIPPCNFGALWHEEEVEGATAYLLESEAQIKLVEKDEEIARLKEQLQDASQDRGAAVTVGGKSSYIARERCGCVVGAVVDDPEASDYRRLDMKHTLREWINEDMIIERVSVEWVRSHGFTRCAVHAVVQEALL